MSVHAIVKHLFRDSDQWKTSLDSQYVSYLHITSHKFQNNKIAEKCILSKNVKKVLFYLIIKTTFFGQDPSKIFVFLHYSVRLFKYLWLF